VQQAACISFLQLEVSDVERSLRWYRRSLGLKPQRGGPANVLLGASLTLALVGGTPSRARGFRFGLRLDTREAVRAWRAHLDHSSAMPTSIVEQDGVYGFSVVDPDGYVLDIGTVQPEDRSLEGPNR
jgi:catechol 2,3-dioxygenase-like lactoylglutathione lyase family enzyme